ncbi:MAG: hypothetical protein HPM95_02945 [Alphaproteobacteria bacterium]|nr:hypothetical protein [Alphaproteobacteria bacterium]
MLRLTKAGRTLFNESLPRFVDYEHMMLEALDETERETLSGLMAKLVMASTPLARPHRDGRGSAKTNTSCGVNCDAHQ